MEKNNNYVKYPVLMLFLTILIMVAVSYIPGNSDVMGVTLKKVDILADLKPEEKTEEDDFQYEYDKDFFDESSLVYPQSEEFNTASFDLASITFTKLNNKFAGKDAVNYADRDQPQIKHQKIQGNLKQMKHFFDALKKSKSQKVRVAHYGDSIIEGDLITMNLRNALQKEFGGSGVGFLGMTSEDIKFRMTTKHTFSNNGWETINVRSNVKRIPVGINGEVYIPDSRAWTQFETTRKFRELSTFGEGYLYYGQSRGGGLTYEIDGKPNTAQFQKADKGVNELDLKVGKGTKSIKLEFSQKEQAHLFGISLEDGNGVVVDNLPLRGQSGENLTKIPADVLKEFNKLRDYKLIIFQFGLNVVGKIDRDPIGYERDMIKVIEHYKKAFPETSFLMVSVNDKGFKKGTQITTDPSVLKLLAVQQQIVKKTDIAFWNLFEAMGGENSMEDWVTANPPLASKDYTHFNDQGAEKVGELLAEALIKAYKEN